MRRRIKGHSLQITSYHSFTNVPGNSAVSCWVSNQNERDGQACHQAEEHGWPWRVHQNDIAWIVHRGLALLLFLAPDVRTADSTVFSLATFDGNKVLFVALLLGSGTPQQSTDCNRNE